MILQKSHFEEGDSIQPFSLIMKTITMMVFVAYFNIYFIFAVSSSPRENQFEDLLLCSCPKHSEFFTQFLGLHRESIYQSRRSLFLFYLNT